MMKYDDIKLPRVEKISSKSIGEDIFPFIPGDEENNKVWEDMFKEMFTEIKKKFDERGIEMPRVTIKHDKKSINEIKEENDGNTYF